MAHAAMCNCNFSRTTGCPIRLPEPHYSARYLSISKVSTRMRGRVVSTLISFAFPLGAGFALQARAQAGKTSARFFQRCPLLAAARAMAHSRRGHRCTVKKLIEGSMYL